MSEFAIKLLPEVVVTFVFKFCLQSRDYADYKAFNNNIMRLTKSELKVNRMDFSRLALNSDFPSNVDFKIFLEDTVKISDLDGSHKFFGEIPREIPVNKNSAILTLEDTDSDSNKADNTDPSVEDSEETHNIQPPEKQDNENMEPPLLTQVENCNSESDVLEANTSEPNNNIGTENVSNQIRKLPERDKLVTLDLKAEWMEILLTYTNEELAHVKTRIGNKYITVSDIDSSVLSTTATTPDRKLNSQSPDQHVQVLYASRLYNLHGKLREKPLDVKVIPEQILSHYSLKGIKIPRKSDLNISRQGHLDFKVKARELLKNVKYFVFQKKEAVKVPKKRGSRLPEPTLCSYYQSCPKLRDPLFRCTGQSGECPNSVHKACLDSLCEKYPRAWELYDPVTNNGNTPCSYCAPDKWKYQISHKSWVEVMLNLICDTITHCQSVIVK